MFDSNWGQMWTVGDEINKKQRETDRKRGIVIKNKADKARKKRNRKRKLLQKQRQKI